METLETDRLELGSSTCDQNLPHKVVASDTREI